jgi:hypothetical protein
MSKIGKSILLNSVVSFVGIALTLPVSSKALLVYQDCGEQTFKPKDLLRLSAIMIPTHLVLAVVFYLTYWQWVGLKF